MCIGCHKQKLSCQTGEAVRRRKLAKVLDEEEQEDSGNDEGRNGSRRGWLAKFSTLKVGPPRGTKPVTGRADMGAQNGTEDKLISLHQLVRTAGEVAKKRLKWYHGFSHNFYRFWLTPQS